jgi:hypothetical protein
MKRTKKIYWKIFIAILSFKKMFDLNISDIVIHRGSEYSLTGGKRYGGQRGTFWTMQHKDGHRITLNSKVDKFHKKVSISNYIGSFKLMHRFYMTNWFDIWVNSGILPWMKSCNIW